jgi:hypothetical protein
MSAPAAHADFMVRDSRQPGHFWADNEVLDVYGPKLGVFAFAVYMVMTRRADNSTGECILSTRRIAAQLDMSLGMVVNVLRRIVELGLARKVLDSEHGKPAVYVLADVKALGCSPHERGCSPHERGVHPMNTQYGKKDFLNTKPTPPTPLKKGGADEVPILHARKRRRDKEIPRGPCAKHPDSGLTQWGTCWACYSEQYSGDRPAETGGTTDAQDDGSGSVRTPVHASDTASRTTS